MNQKPNHLTHTAPAPTREKPMISEKGRQAAVYLLLASGFQCSLNFPIVGQSSTCPALLLPVAPRNVWISAPDTPPLVYAAESQASW